MLGSLIPPPQREIQQRCRKLRPGLKHLEWADMLRESRKRLAKKRVEIRARHAVRHSQGCLWQQGRARDVFVLSTLGEGDCGNLYLRILPQGQCHGVLNRQFKGQLLLSAKIQSTAKRKSHKQNHCEHLLWRSLPARSLSVADNFFDHCSGHASTSLNLRAMRMHFCQQLLSHWIDETHCLQMDLGGDPMLRRAFLPAALQ